MAFAESEIQHEFVAGNVSLIGFWKVEIIAASRWCFVPKLLKPLLPLAAFHPLDGGLKKLLLRKRETRLLFRNLACGKPRGKEYPSARQAREPFDILLNAVCGVTSDAALNFSARGIDELRRETRLRACGQVHHVARKNKR